ncbi:hypothetical protein Ga0123461_2363 [Mariprofundus aestuarium]|uniref:Uncharacterized protein n=1 Tax=Mariprofundus aestuarium TaxID=1921086 RepID=A0A2K8L0L3_MARES|nr:hypothetical protein [Mariprofundus aestuarium]ATX80763.1 hypothetical protein Ga0123461_2363 [Mariprofundus aestuarium]
MFRHPVGIFPPGARWYLASIAILALLCVAMHLSLQIKAQKQAEAAIHNWADAAEVKIGDVRYHLLRNGLILKKIEIKRGNDSLSIDHILVSANPTLLTGEAPRLGSVVISGLQAELHHSGQLNAWQHDKKLQRIWQAANTLQVDDGTLMLYLADESAAPLIIDAIQLRQQVQGEVRTISLSSQFHGAPVQAQWIRSGTSHWSSKGEVSWQEIDASLLTATIGTGPSFGYLSGEVQWSSGSEAEKPEALSLSGKVTLDPEEEGDASYVSTLKLNGTQSDDSWDVAINSSGWPLDSWGAYLPEIEGRQLQGGVLDGELLLHRSDAGLLFSSSKGVLHNIIYAPIAGSESENWGVESLYYRDAKLDSEHRKLSVTTLKLSRPAITLQPLIRKNRRSSPAPLWSIHAEAVDIDALNVLIDLPEGDIQLSGLSGTCTLTSKGMTDIKLKSVAGNDSDDPEWAIQGEVLRQGGTLNAAKLDVQAKHIPLTQLRPLLPLKSSQSSPLILDGTTSLSVNALLNRGEWLLHGKATSENPYLAHAGNRWMAESISTRFGPVGTGLKKQHVDSLTAEGWHYIATLIPLSLQTAGQDAAARSDQEKTWWTESLVAGKWDIDDIRWKNGKISVGQPDSYWVTNAEFGLSPLAANRPSRVSLRGEMGGGVLMLDGKWSPLSEPMRFLGKISLESATPLFLSEWMTASGMPKPVRGRISASLNVENGEEPGHYTGKVSLNLERPLAEHEVTANDPMISRTGFNTIDLLSRLAEGNEQINLQFPVSGNWNGEPLDLQLLGLSLQQVLRDSAEKSATVISTSRSGKKRVETRIRLHERGGLSLNERIRLLKVVKKMKANPKLVVDLVPKWTGEAIDFESMQRIQYTHYLIGRFFDYRGISKQRVFPSAPTAQDHAGEIASIWVVLSTRK